MLEKFFKKYKEKEEDKFLYLNFQKKIYFVIYFVLFLVNGTILYLLFFIFYEYYKSVNNISHYVSNTFIKTYNGFILVFLKW